MNFEELLRQRNHSGHRLVRLPIGTYVQNRIDVDKAKLENISFAVGLRTEMAANLRLNHPGQLHFAADGGDATTPDVLQMERGNYVSLDRLLADNPAFVSQPGFIEDIVAQLFDVLSYLHAQGIWHVCFAPSTIFVHKGGHELKLLNHGSFYLGVSNQSGLYEGFSDYVAPEVLSHGAIDERCDIYGAGRLIEFLFSQAPMPFEYKRVVQRAIRQAPEDRYQTVLEMRRALNLLRNVRKSALRASVALLFAIIFAVLYFELMPQTRPVTFVRPAPDSNTAAQKGEMLDQGFDSATELGTAPIDTLGLMTAEQIDRQREYEAKTEAIFRKRFTAEADRILSKIYNKELMGANERKFMAASSQVTEELARVQMELAAQASLSEERSQMIATEIVERLSNEKKKTLNFNNIQK